MTSKPFFIDDIADSHAAGRIILMSIDHQFCMEAFDTNIPEISAFDSYNYAHARSLHIARRHNIPVCHVLYDPEGDLITHALSTDDRKTLKARLQILYQNGDDLTVKHRPDEKTGHTQLIHHDLLAEVHDGDLVAFKEEFDAHSNQLLRKVLTRMDIADQLYNGMIGSKCVMASMRSGMELGRRATAIGDAIEREEPVPTDVQRMRSSLNLFRHCLPGSLVTDCEELDEALSEVLQPR